MFQQRQGRHLTCERTPRQAATWPAERMPASLWRRAASRSCPARPAAPTNPSRPHGRGGRDPESVHPALHLALPIVVHVSIFAVTVRLRRVSLWRNACIVPRRAQRCRLLPLALHPPPDPAAPARPHPPSPGAPSPPPAPAAPARLLGRSCMLVRCSSICSKRGSSSSNASKSPGSLQAGGSRHSSLDQAWPRTSGQVVPAHGPHCPTCQ